MGNPRRPSPPRSAVTPAGTHANGNGPTATRNVDLDQLHAEDPKVKKTVTVGGTTYEVAPVLPVSAVLAWSKLQDPRHALASLETIMHAVFGDNVDEVAGKLVSSDVGELLTRLYGTTQGESAASSTS